MGYDIPIIGRVKSQLELSRRDVQFMAWLHEWAVRNGVSLVCKACDHAIVGQNTGHEARPEVACQCRQWTYMGKDL